MNNAIQNEQNEMNALLNELDEIIAGNGGGGTTGGGENIDPETGWDLDKVTKVESEDKIIVPGVKIDFGHESVEMV